MSKHYDLSGSSTGPTLEPGTRIRLVVEDIAGDGWDASFPPKNFWWSRDARVTIEVFDGEVE